MVKKIKFKKCLMVRQAENKLKEALKSKDYTKVEKKKIRTLLKKVKDPTVARAICD